MTYQATTADISDALINGIKGLFGKRLKLVDTHPGQWNDTVVKRIVMTYPAVYVAWLGSRLSDTPNSVISTWGIFVSARVLNGRQTNEVGIYQINEIIVAWLHRQRLTPAGNFTFTQAVNLWSDLQSSAGTAVYGLYFEAPQLIIDSSMLTSTLDDYATHYQQWENGNPNQEALIHLPIQGERNDN